MKVNPEHYFVLHGGKTIKDLEELAQVLKTIDRKTFEYHVNDSKNDFANWIQYVFRSQKLSESIADLRYEELKTIIELIQRHVNELKILVANGGSSSLKFQLLDFSSKNILMKGMIDAIGLDRCNINLTVN